MKKFILLIIVSTMIFGCKTMNKLPDTIGDPKNAVNFGYQPIDPLPVDLYFDTHNGDRHIIPLSEAKVTNSQIMASLPDETMRLAIGQFDFKGNISFATAKLGYAGSSYIVILDYIKFDTKSLPIYIAKDSLGNVIDFKLADGVNPDAIIPMYVGIGLRFTATIQVNEGTVDLGNLFALGLAAESKKVTGTLLIQTLGISGKDISSLIPMPSQINTTTIENAIMSLASIKAKIYEEDIKLNPRIVGFYNNIGGGQSTVHKFITSVLSHQVIHVIE